eukprot:6856334-Alexandrium_andersonii.AAC.2
MAGPVNRMKRQRTRGMRKPTMMPEASFGCKWNRHGISIHMSHPNAPRLGEAPPGHRVFCRAIASLQAEHPASACNT